MFTSKQGRTSKGILAQPCNSNQPMRMNKTKRMQPSTPPLHQKLKKGSFISGDTWKITLTWHSQEHTLIYHWMGASISPLQEVICVCALWLVAEVVPHDWSNSIFANTCTCSGIIVVYYPSSGSYYPTTNTKVEQLSKSIQKLNQVWICVANVRGTCKLWLM